MHQPTDVAPGEPGSNLASIRMIFAAGGFPRGLGRILGIVGKEADEERILLVGTPNEDHYNPLGSVHGGYVAAMLDSAIALAIYTVLPPGAGYTTIDLKLDFGHFAHRSPVDYQRLGARGYLCVGLFAGWWPPSGSFERLEHQLQRS